MQIRKPHVALLASPGLGHLIPVLELGKRLTHHNLHVTVFVVANDISGERLSELLNSPYGDLLDIVLLPSVDISGLVGVEASVLTQIVVMMHESLPALRSTISAMKFRPTALTVDLFGTEAMTVADEFEMLKCVYIASNTWFFAVTMYASTLDKNELFDEHIIQQQPPKIADCSPVHFEDMLEVFLDHTDPMYEVFLRVGMEMSKADGILINTWEDLEPKTLGARRNINMLGGVVTAPVYPIGPLKKPAAEPVSGSEVLDWLNMQPNESVIYVSFGSGGTLSSKQMIELAWGLKLSKKRFIWVVRPPMDKDVFDSYLMTGNGLASTIDYLPIGFASRTQNVGLVIPMWAPQAEILAHPSVMIS